MNPILDDSQTLVIRRLKLESNVSGSLPFTFVSILALQATRRSCLFVELPDAGRVFIAANCYPVDTPVVVLPAAPLNNGLAFGLGSGAEQETLKALSATHDDLMCRLPRSGRHGQQITLCGLPARFRCLSRKREHCLAAPPVAQ